MNSKLQRVWQWLLMPQVLALIGLLALAAFLFMGADALQVGLVWSAVVLGLACLVWGIVWAVQRWRARQAGQALEQAMVEQGEKAIDKATPDRRDEVAALRERMNEAVKVIKGSRLGQLTGSAALYELPWYMVIGNPAAGKSSAVVKSGLTFPFADSNDNVIQGIGGTRHCDWFFTTEGILLDTAGRYSVHEEDRSEWLGFLNLLKKHRPKAPINGIIIAASVAELGGRNSEFAIALARKLRQRVQELTEQLEVFAPVYVVFTKADLIAGFAEFFEDRDRDERDRVWGATLPYDAQGKQDVVARFDHHFDVLYEGLKEASVTRMSMHRGEQMPPGVLTFPLEFAAIKPTLRTFLATLFEENPYQFRPIFRGFYFTSAVQEGHSTSRASERVAQQFGLHLQPGTSASVYAQGGFFLKELFSKVIFADKQLVQQYTSPVKMRWRLASFVVGVAMLGTLLGGWTWAYLGNRQLVSNVQADLVKAQRLQDGRVDLQSRIEALIILQDRLEQLQAYRQGHPVALGLGLYQGEAIEAKLRQEYFNGLQAVMLLPTTQAIAAYLGDVNAHADQLQPLQRTPEGGVMPVVAGNVHADAQPSAGGTYTQASSTNVAEAYNALKAYLMLGDRSRIEPGHMSDQLTRFWRTWLEANRGTMPREQLIQSAERIMSYSLAQMSDPAFPQQDLNLTLLDQTRENLRKVVKGMPARERIYGEIKARAATRYAPMTVTRLVAEQDRELVAGSHAISGAFTREAWEGYVKEAIQQAANNEMQSTDWVLKTSARDDLTLEGSPEQIQKNLTQLYKTEYVKEWQKFMQGITIQDFGTFEKAVTAMNRLGDPAASPVGRLMQALFDQTSWDNPSMFNEKLALGQQGFVNWFKQSILRMTPSRVNVNVNVAAGQAAVPMGPVGREFEAVYRLMMNRDSSPTLMQNYLTALSKVRTRFNQMKTQGDPGPASRQLMQQTLEGQSELADALKLVDEQMLNGIGDSAKATLRPLLVRPLMQAFGVLIRPTEAEINRVWSAQVYEPFQLTLARKYPFDPSSKMEAAPAEMAKVFGTEGSVAKFVEQALGPLVIRRGDTLTPRTWADMGVRLMPEFTGGLSGWVAASGSGGGGGASGGGAAAAAEAQTVFQLLPQAAPGLTEYTVEIDGQVLRYRNGQASWAHFVWPGPGTPGVKITGVTFDGRTVEFFHEPGRYGLEKMINSAQRRRLEGEQFELRWPQGTASVAVQLRIISNSAATEAPAAPAGQTASAAGARPSGKLPAVVAGVSESVDATTPPVALGGNP